MKKWSILLIALLAACSPGEQSNDGSEAVQPAPEEPEVTDNEEPTEEPVEKPIELHKFFMPNQTTAKFLGDGNEYATYTLTTQHLYEDYIGTFEDNGGTVMQRIYRIEEDRIVKILEEAEAYDADFPALNELELLPEIETYLSIPIEEGTEFNGWTIIAVDQTLETPYEVFENVFILSQEGADQSITERYFVEGYGEVKRVFRMPNGEEADFEVTSTLTEVN